MRPLLVALTLVVSFGAAEAGNNSAGKAWLSWDREGTTFQIAQPSSYQFPLYLHLSDAPDIHQLAVHLRFDTSDSSHCYDVVSSASDLTCGWATDAPPGGSFEDDSSYTWSISFAAGSAKSCVVYTVSAAECSTSSSATFWLAGVATKDGNGGVDSLEILEQAVIGPMTDAPPDTSSGGVVPGIVLMEFDASTLPNPPAAISLSRIPAPATRGFLGARGFAGAHKMYHDATPADTLLPARDGGMVRVPDVSRWYVVKLRDDVNVESLVDSLRALTGVVRARAGRRIALFAAPNDPELGSEWQLIQPGGIHALEAWDLGTGRSDVIMGVIDTGVDYTHGDLDPGDRSHVLPGIDTGDDDSDPRDDAPRYVNSRRLGGHGSSVAGLIGALTNNSRQVAGVMWNCKLLPVKVYRSLPPWWCPWCGAGGGNDWEIADGINWATNHGANVINMSFGGPDFLNWSELLGSGDPIATSTYTAFRVGVVPMAGMGNDGDATVNYPAAYPWVVAVGATNTDSSRATFSNIGPHIAVVAPGVDTWTVDRDLGTYTFSGTSAATPVASGVAGLILSEGRDWGVNLTNEDVAEILKRSARDLLNPGWDDATGHGLVDAWKALKFLNPPYSIKQGSAVGGTATLTWPSHTHNFTNNGGLPSGQYYGVEQYEARTRVTTCGPYSLAPAAWSRTRQTIGWSAANPNSELPWGEVLNVTTTGFDVRTFVYRIPYDLQGRYVNWWYPCRPEQAVNAWTVLGILPLQSAAINGSHSDCAVSLAATCCGGGVDLSYEWYERPAGGEWSGIVGTGPTYNRYLPYQDLEFKLVARSGATAVQDTHYVNYRNCVVSVGEAAVKEMQLTFTPNPTRGTTIFGLQLPTAGHAKLSVYDVNGRLVGRIADQLFPAGIHRVEWNLHDEGGSRAPSGLYFAKLGTASGEKTARIVILQ